MASAALMASRHVMTKRANEAKTQQEEAVKERLRQSGMIEVRPRTIRTLDEAPERGHFCGESIFGNRKADIVLRLWDGRVMPTECKVSNSSTNSVNLNCHLCSASLAYVPERILPPVAQGSESQIPAVAFDPKSFI